MAESAQSEANSQATRSTQLNKGSPYPTQLPQGNNEPRSPSFSFSFSTFSSTLPFLLLFFLLTPPFLLFTPPLLRDNNKQQHPAQDQAKPSQAKLKTRNTKQQLTTTHIHNIQHTAHNTPCSTTLTASLPPSSSSSVSTAVCRVSSVRSIFRNKQGC